MTRKIFALLMLLALTGSASAENVNLGEGYNVPQGFSSIIITNSDGTAIQNAVENIQDGGTIILSGDFKLKRDINIKKPLTIKAMDSNNKATLEMRKGILKRVLRCEGKGGSITLENLVIKGGYATNGGGVKVDANTKTMTITNCDIIENIALLGGGGLYSDAENLILTNCNINNNVVTLFGGGMMATSDVITVTSCDVSKNASQTGNGGGIYFTRTAAEMNNCKVNNNISKLDGSGIYLYSKQLTLTNCEVSGNLKDNVSSDIYAEPGKGTYTKN